MTAQCTFVCGHLLPSQLQDERDSDKTEKVKNDSLLPLMATFAY